MMDFEEKTIKKNYNSGNAMKCIERLDLKGNKGTYSKLDNAPMSVRQLYIIPTLGVCKVWKSIKRVSKV